MTFQQLRYLLEISKHHSISKAAAALFVTQPSISKAVRDLENELAITILDRTNKGVAFTQEGNELLFYAKVLLEQTEAIHDNFNNKQLSLKKKLAISSQHYAVAVEALVLLLESFEEIEYELSLREGKTMDVLEDIYSSKSMIGLLSITDLNKPYFERHFKTKGLQFIELAAMKQHVFLREEHPLAAEKELSLQQLKSYPYLSYQQDDMLIHLAEETLHPQQLKQIIYVNDRGTMNNLISQTNSYNIGTGFIVKGFMPSNIKAIPLQNSQKISIGYIMRQNTNIPTDIATYLHFVQQSLNKALL